MGFSFISRPRSFEASCHSLLMVLGGAGAKGDSGQHQHPPQPFIRKALHTTRLDEQEDEAGDTNKANGTQEDLQVVTGLADGGPWPMRTERHVIRCTKQGNGHEQCPPDRLRRAWGQKATIQRPRRPIQRAKLTHRPFSRLSTALSSPFAAGAPAARGRTLSPLR